MNKLIEKLEKEYDKKFPIYHHYDADFWRSCPLEEDGFRQDNIIPKCNCGAIKKHEEIKSFIRSHLPSLLQAVGEELIGKNHKCHKEIIESGGMMCMDCIIRNEEKALMRSRLKEIIRRVEK